MFREDAAKLKPGDILEYSLSVVGLGNGMLQKTYIQAEFVRPSKRADLVVIRPVYIDESQNRVRTVHIDKLTLLYAL